MTDDGFFFLFTRPINGGGGIQKRGWDGSETGTIREGDGGDEEGFRDLLGKGDGDETRDSVMGDRTSVRDDLAGQFHHPLDRFLDLIAAHHRKVPEADLESVPVVVVVMVPVHLQEQSRLVCGARELSCCDRVAKDHHPFGRFKDTHAQWDVEGDREKV